MVSFFYKQGYAVCIWGYTEFIGNLKDPKCYGYLFSCVSSSKVTTGCAIFNQILMLMCLNLQNQDYHKGGRNGAVLRKLPIERYLSTLWLDRNWAPVVIHKLSELHWRRSQKRYSNIPQDPHPNTTFKPAPKPTQVCINACNSGPPVVLFCYRSPV